MPAPALASMADKAGVSKERAEHLWDKAKKLASKGYEYGKKSPHHWALVMGIVKKMLGKKKTESLTFAEFNAACLLAEQTIDEGELKEGDRRDEMIEKILQVARDRRGSWAFPPKKMWSSL